MLTKILSRGGPASGYLFVRYFKFVLLLVALPVSMLFAWMIPAAAAGLVRLANSERYRAAWYLGVPQPGMLPAGGTTEAGRRRDTVPGQVVQAQPAVSVGSAGDGA